jgi:hypothetical protein
MKMNNELLLLLVALRVGSLSGCFDSGHSEDMGKTYQKLLR